MSTEDKIARVKNLLSDPDRLPVGQASALFREWRGLREKQWETEAVAA